MIKTFKVQTFLEVPYCNKCKVQLKKGEYILYTNPPKVEYVCPKCGYKEYFIDLYPRPIYRIIEEIKGKGESDE